MQRDLNYYTLLGLKKDATPEEIRRAYHAAALRFHPDVNVNPGETELFLGIQEAYETLSQPDKRAGYDASIPQEAEVLPVTLNQLLSRKVIPQLDEPQLIYTLLELAPRPDFIPLATAPLNICLVIDRSTSMQGERMDNVKETAIQLLRDLKPQDILSIVTFSDRANILLRAGEHHKPHDIETRIHLLQAGGGTEIYQGLEKGYLEIRRYLNPSHVNHIILLTDGKTYGDEDACQALADRAASEGVGLTCLGIGEEWNDVFLDDLASRTGGHCIYISQPDQIMSQLRDKFRNLGHVYAERINFDYKTFPGVHIREAFRLEPDASPLQAKSPIQLGNLPRDGQIKILFEFLLDPIPEKQKKIRMIEGFLRLEYPGQNQQTSTIFIDINVPVSKNPLRETPLQTLVDAVRHLTIYRMQERARHEVSGGLEKHAAIRLHRLATRLISLGERDLTQAVLRAADNLQKGDAVSSEGEKQIKYGTRGLFPPRATRGLSL